MDYEDYCFDGAVFELYLSDIHINDEKWRRAVLQGVGGFYKFSSPHKENCECFTHVGEMPHNSLSLPLFPCPLGTSAHTVNDCNQRGDTQGLDNASWLGNAEILNLVHSQLQPKWLSE